MRQAVLLMQRVPLSYLLTDDVDLAETIAQELQETNMERQEIDGSIHEEARANVAAQGHLADYVTVVAGENWHPGVIGIVASRLVEEFLQAYTCY